MKLFPYGRYLPVHCCCDATLRIGWVPVPDYLQRVGRFSVALCEPPRVRLFGPMGPVSPELTRNQIDTEIAWLDLNDDRVLAVKTAHHPIEQWRKVRGFLENRAVPSLPALKSRAARWSVAASCASSDPQARDATR